MRKRPRRSSTTPSFSRPSESEPTEVPTTRVDPRVAPPLTGPWNPAGEVWTIVVAGGAGHRFGGAKQLAILGGQRVLDRSLATARRMSDGTVLVTTADTVAGEVGSADFVVAGGSTRSGSVRNGLAVVPPEAAVIVVHDAARPLAPADTYERVIAAIRRGADAAITAVAVVDTLKRVTDSMVVETVDRSALVAVQTPQAFRADVLREAHRSGADATDDAALVEAIGCRVVVVEGDPRSRKLTTFDDLTVLEALVSGVGEDR